MASSGLFGTGASAGSWPAPPGITPSHVFAQRIEAMRAGMTVGQTNQPPSTLPNPASPAQPIPSSIPVPTSPPFRYGSGAGMGPPSPATHPRARGPRARGRERSHSPGRERGGRRTSHLFDGRSVPAGPKEEMDWLSAFGNV